MNTDLVTTSELFELLAKATRDAVWNWNIEANTILWNEGYSNLFGYDNQEIANDGLGSWTKHVHNDDRDRIVTGIQQVIDQGGTNWSDQYRFWRADGTCAFVLDRGYILHRDGRAIRMVGAMQDISEQVSLQQARAESDERLRFALQSAQLGTWELDPIQGVVSWDSRCQELCGLTNESSISYNRSLDFIHPDDKNRVEKAVQWALSPESGGHYNTSFRTIGVEDGKLRWVRFMGQTHFTESGTAYRFSGVAEDITDEVLAKEKADLSEQQARMALEGSGAGSFMVSLLTNEIVYSKNFGRILLGEERENIRWTVFINHIHPDDMPIRDQAHKVALKTGNLIYEARFVWKDKSVHRVKVIGQYIFDTNLKPTSVSGIVLDVTEQTERAKALREAEERFAIAFNNTSTGIAFVDQQANFNLVNEAYSKLLGYATDELCTLNSFALTHPDDRAWNRQLFEEVFEGKRPSFDLVKRYIHKDGSIRWVELNVTRVTDAQDETQSIIVIAHDINERVEAEAKLRASEERIRNIITHAPVAISILSGRTMAIETANNSMLGIWGKDATIIGLPFREALPELKEQGFVRLLEEVYDSGVAHYGIETFVQLQRKGQLEDGYYDFVYAPIRNELDEINGVIIVATEVTTQVKAKIALQESEQRFRDLIAEAPVATALYIGRDLIIELPNEAMLKLWGKDRSIIGKPLAQALPELQDQPFLQLLDEVYATRDTYHSQETKTDLLIDGEPKEYYFNFMYQPLTNADGEVYAILNMAVDVTEQVLVRKEIEALASNLETQIQARTEQLMTSNYDLRRSNDNLEKFAYIASHDLQEPLRKIQSFGDILKGQYADSLGPGIDYLERMQTAAARMSLLIRDLLTFSRISTRQEVDIPVSLNQVVADVLDDLEVVIEQSDAQVLVADLPTISGDESQLRQLFQNLLSNALKFQKPDTIPVVHIKVERVKAEQLPTSIQPTRPASYYHLIHIIDNGIGFDQKYADQIFQVFQRLHGRNEYAGTGIGLAICEKVAVNHGGMITAASKPGEGATFLLYLPVNR
ncbi:hypothetical protein GCM10028805_55730 [Spirosoma harenae]